MRQQIPISVLCFLVLGGCALPQRSVKPLALREDTTALLSFPADLRGFYVKQRGSQLQVCAEPAPDVALSSLEKITANLKATHPSGAGGEGAFSSEFSATVAALAGRTQLVLVAREMLYRACEFSLNHPGPGSEAAAREMYRDVAKLLTDLGKAEKASAAAAEKNAEAERNKSEKALQDAIKATKGFQ